MSNLVRWISDSITGGSEEYKLKNTLQNSTMFKFISKSHQDEIIKRLERIEFKKGDVLMYQDDLQESAYFIIEGHVIRQREVENQLHNMGTLGGAGSDNTIGMLHLIRQDPIYNTVIAVSDGVAYQLHSNSFKEILKQYPEIHEEIIFSLCKEIRKVSKKYALTPLFLQKGYQGLDEPLPWFAVTCAASVEAFYRSALNAYINAALTNAKVAKLFPNMHVQLPTRILYINGFKGIRHIIDKNIQIDLLEYPQLSGLCLAVLPGLIMSPISSLLEASNAGHVNKEDLKIRWMRGFVPRVGREVIFGVGINQLSDYYEERLSNIFSNKNSIFRNLFASFGAGCVAGYLSHVPHNLSALKLLNPAVSYKQHFKSLSSNWESKIKVNTPYRRLIIPTLTCLFPKGVTIRTAQIAGSFIIINSTIHALKHINVEITDSRRKRFQTG